MGKLNYDRKVEKDVLYSNVQNHIQIQWYHNGDKVIVRIPAGKDEKEEVQEALNFNSKASNTF